MQRYKNSFLFICISNFFLVHFSQLSFSEDAQSPRFFHTQSSIFDTFEWNSQHLRDALDPTIHQICYERDIVLGEVAPSIKGTIVCQDTYVYEYFGLKKNMNLRYVIFKQYDKKFSADKNEQFPVATLFDRSTRTDLKFAYEGPFYVMLFDQVLRVDHTTSRKEGFKHPYIMKFSNVTEKMKDYVASAEKDRVIYVQEEYKYKNNPRKQLTNDYLVFCRNNTTIDSSEHEVKSYKFVIESIASDNIDNMNSYSAKIEVKPYPELSATDKKDIPEKYLQNITVKVGDILNLPSENLKITRICPEKLLDDAYIPGHIVVSKFE